MGIDMHPCVRGGILCLQFESSFQSRGGIFQRDRNHRLGGFAGVAA